MPTLNNPVEVTKIVAAATVAYLAAVVFTDFGEEDQPPKDADFSTAAILDASSTVADFLLHCHAQGLLGPYFAEHKMTPEQLGHDFWFTRNRHGAGFWDRGLGTLGDRLTAAAHDWQEAHVYLGDDSLVYFA